MSTTFYTAPMSSAVVAHWAVEELGVPQIEKVVLDLTKKETRKPEYLALNPHGKVPLLVVDGTPIFETIAIISYLGETYGVEKGLWPSQPLERAKGMRWMAWAQVTLGEALSRYNHACHPQYSKAGHSEGAAKEAKADVERHLGILDAELAKAKQPYLVGDRFTLADVHVASWANWAGFSGFDLSKLPALTAYAARCNARPAAAALRG